MIETIMDHEKYRQYPYKLENIRETLHELIMFEDESNGGYSVKEREYIALLNLKF